MNISKAKSIIGIPRGQSVSGADGIAQARRNGDDTLAAQRSEAREVFRRRQTARNRCEVCGTTINANATRCRNHQRTRTRQALTLPGQRAASLNSRARTERSNPNGNARVDVSPEGGLLARLGFYSAPVQKVVRQWAGRSRPDMLKRLFTEVAMAVMHQNSSVNVPAGTMDFWQCTFEFGEALCEVMQQRRKPDVWLLEMSKAATNGRFPTWLEVSQKIKAQGGPEFEVGTLTQAYKRLRLTTPPGIADDYKQSRPS